MTGKRQRIILREAVLYAAFVMMLGVWAGETPRNTFGLAILFMVYRAFWLGDEWRRAGATPERDSQYRTRSRAHR